jgi:ankyrin repeat protein
LAANQAGIGELNLNEPLSWAAHNGCNDSILVLLLNGADINNKDSQGNTALHWAAYNNHGETVQLLLAHGADERILNHNNLTPAKFSQVSSSSAIQFSRDNTDSSLSPMPKVIEDMVNEIAALKAKVSKLETEHAAPNFRKESYFTRSSSDSDAKILARFGFIKN